MIYKSSTFNESNISREVHCHQERLQGIPRQTKINILVPNNIIHKLQISYHYRFPMTQNLHGLDFDLSRSSGVHSINRVGLPITCT